MTVPLWVIIEGWGTKEVTRKGCVDRNVNGLR